MIPQVYGDVYNTRKLSGQPVPVLRCNGESLPTTSGDGFDFPEHELYEDIGTPMMSKVAWLTRKMAILGSIRSFKSVSSTTSTIANGLSKKPINQSQLSLYDKISRNLSIFDSHSHKGDGRSRRSCRQRSVSDVTKPKLEEINGVENKSYQNEDPESRNDLDDFEDSIDLLINRKRLETITENQNSPYSTQASQCTTRRMSAQSIFTDGARRGSLPFTAPVLELFHENEVEEIFVVDGENSLKKQEPSSEQKQEYAKCSATKHGLLEYKSEADKTNSLGIGNAETKEIMHEADIEEMKGSPSPTLPRRSIFVEEIRNLTDHSCFRIPVMSLAFVEDIIAEENSDNISVLDKVNDNEGAPVFV